MCALQTGKIIPISSPNYVKKKRKKEEKRKHKRDQRFFNSRTQKKFRFETKTPFLVIYIYVRVCVYTNRQ